MNRLYRILYVGGFELPDKNAAAHRVIQNAKILRDLGCEVIFVDTNREISQSIIQMDDSYGFARWSLKKTNAVLYSIDNIVKIIEQMGDIQIVIAYNYPSVALFKLRNYCRKNKIKITADVTEWYGFQGENFLAKIAKSLDSLLRMRLLHRKLDGVIAISKYLENYYKKKVPTVYIPPLVDKEDTKWRKKENTDKSDRIKIVYAGTPGKHKDKLNIILRALQLCNHQKLEYRVIGITKAEYLSYYPDDTELLMRLEDCVVFLGKMAHTDVIHELQSADFSLFYRDINRVSMAGFPTKFSESLSCGTPVITNRTSDLESFLKEGINGYWIDNIENDLPMLLKKDSEELKKVKLTVDTDLFDYRSYIPVVKYWMEQITN